MKIEMDIDIEKLKLLLTNSGYSKIEVEKLSDKQLLELFEIVINSCIKERLMRRKRQREGIDAAKKRGQHMGRPTIPKPNNYEEVITQWKNGKITAVSAMKMLGITRSMFYRWVKE